MRRCRCCHLDKAISEYSPDRGKPRRICKACAVAQERARQLEQGLPGAQRRLNNWNRCFDRDPVARRFTMAKSAAKQAGHEFTITRELFRQLNALPCHYCGGPLPEKGRGLDRLDNARGYTPGNVQPCCGDCNALRGDRLTPEETRVAVAAVQAHRQSRNTKEAA